MGRMRDKTGPEIKLFVSHRIDLDSVLVDDPLYVPVRCGAVFDQREGVAMLGDDTGDNISARRKSFCEFTVQYWAWKNVQADYCGLCHYRRYLSFSDKRYPTDAFGMVRNPALCGHSMAKYRLLDAGHIRALISQYDAVVAEPAPVTRRRVAGGVPKTVEELWAAHDGLFFERKHREALLPLIDRMAPAYSGWARDYFSSGGHRGYNCYVLRRELFQELCQFQFPILFEVERQVDDAGYTDLMRRTPAFLGEMLYGVFIHRLIGEGRCRIKETQLVYFDDTRRDVNLPTYLLKGAKIGLEQTARAILDPLFPLGTRRREWLKAKRK